MKILDSFIEKQENVSNAHYEIKDSGGGSYYLIKKSSGDTLAEIVLVGDFCITEGCDKKTKNILVTHFSDKSVTLVVDGVQFF